MQITHAFINPIPDDPAFLGTKPSDWNSNHVAADIVNADISATAAIDESKLNLNFATHAAVTLGTANGLSLSTQALSLALASTSTIGALSDTDWNTFNSKQSALTFPLSAANGGTGKANGALSTLTLPNFPITIAGGVTGGTYTLPATSGTVALLEVNNIFTGINYFTRGVATNTFLSAAGNSTLSGTNNIGVGANVLIALTSGAQNLGLGANALQRATTGNYNFALGVNTLSYLVGGTNNVAIGVSANQYSGLYATNSYNVSIGASSLKNVSGDGNVAIGQEALAGVSLGSANNVNYNIGIGYAAGFSISTNAVNNIFIGQAAGRASTSGGNNIYIGANAGRRQTTASNLIIIDNVFRASTTEETENAYLYGSTTTGGYLRVNIPTTTTNAIVEINKIHAYVSTAATGGAAGFGGAYGIYAETATDGTSQQQGRLWSKWIVATNGSETSAVGLDAYTNSTAQEFISGQGDAGGVKLALYGGTRVARGAALTTQLTTITFTAPGTPDYALQDVTNITPYGFTDAEELRTFISVVKNLQTRCAELEARLGSATGINAFA